MSLVDTSTIRAEQHVEIGNLLIVNVGILVERWAHRAKIEQPEARRVHHDVLLDHLIELLQNLGRSLAESLEPANGQHCLPAAKHGEQRWDAGWSLPEVIRDYQILRVTILEFLEESLDRPLRYREVLAIGLALDESISASVVVYVKGRDLHFAENEARRIKELQQIQNQLKLHAEALQQADRRKNEFLAILAHELRNPLAPVRHAIQVLRLKNSPDPDLQWARELIERQAQLMARMVDDLFDISRLAHGKIKLEKEIVNVSTVLDRSAEQVRPMMQARKHLFTVSLPSQPVWADADMLRLVQVFVNLLVNAAKYTPDGGKIELTVETTENHLVVRLRDTGIGIPAELLPRIFEPFAQDEPAEERIKEGLGLGLALVKNLVELHGGRVEAFSAGRGQGSEFVVHLPSAKGKPNQQESPQKTSEAPKSVSRRLLVVDDNQDAAQSLGVLLRLIGHEVQTAFDGPTALQMIKAHEPEIVFLDIGMPEMNGLEVARRIRHELGLKDVILVALTGYGHDRDRHKSTIAGFDVHLVKPVEIDHLHSILQNSTTNGDPKPA